MAAILFVIFLPVIVPVVVIGFGVLFISIKSLFSKSPKIVVIDESIEDLRKRREKMLEERNAEYNRKLKKYAKKWLPIAMAPIVFLIIALLII